MDGGKTYFGEQNGDSGLGSSVGSSAGQDNGIGSMSTSTAYPGSGTTSSRGYSHTIGSMSTSTAYPGTRTTSSRGDTNTISSMSSDVTSTTMTIDSGLGNVGSMQNHLDNLPKMDMVELLLQYTDQGKTKENIIQVPPQMKLADAKQKIREVTQVHPGQQVLTLCNPGTHGNRGNRVCMDDDQRTVCDYGFRPGTKTRARIEVSTRARGGGGGLV